MTIAAQQPAPAEAEPALGQSLRSRHVTMIAIGGIIGAGLFVSSSTSIATVGPAVIVSYLLAGLVILLIMRMLSEMAMLTPDAGSFTELIRIGLGDTAGFVSGWLYWYFWVAVVAIEAIAGAVIIADWIALPTWQIGMMLLAVMTGVNLLSTRSYGEFEFWFSTAKVTAILIFIGIAALWATGVTAPSGNTFSNLTAHGGFAPKGWLAVLAGVTSIIFMLCGAEVATIAAAEAREPARIIVPHHRHGRRAHPAVLHPVYGADRQRRAVDRRRTRQIAVHRRAAPYACPSRDAGDDHRHPGRRAVLPEFGHVYHLARDVRHGAARLCPPRAGDA